MIIVDEIWEEAKKIFGHCREPKLFRQITDSIELLANKGEIDPLVGFVDLCVSGQCVTLPREVETVLSVNICGRPALGRDQLFEFHLNGPGSCGVGARGVTGFGRACTWTWTDGGNWPTYKDLICPSKLVAFLDNPDDAGKQLWVYGFDDQNRPLRTNVGGVWRDGYLVPTIYGYSVPDDQAPTISRITAIVKEVTVANVRLSSFDSSSTTGTLIGIYEPDETKPLYRRMKIYPCGPWVRIGYRKKSYEVRSVHDRILLHSRPAFLLAMRAFKFYDDGDLANGNAFEANATRLLTEKEHSLTGPAGNPIQVIDLNSISDRCDFVN